MGYIAHHAIVVIGSDYDDATEKAHAKAVELGCKVTPIVESAINGYRSFLICPDGSKEGWDASNDGDARRAAWIEWTATTLHEDGSGPLEWAEVRISPDDGDATMARHSWSEPQEQGKE